MEFAFSDKVQRLQARLLAFMDEHVHPNERTYADQLAGAADRWQPVPVVQELKGAAKREGLWNLFLAHSGRGAGDPRCAILIVMGKTDPANPDKHRQQSMILVPRGTPGVTIRRMLPVFGYDDAPHGHAEITFEDVRVPAENILLGEGRGFEIAQGRLGPGRIHHCMRTIGLAERALEMMCRRSLARHPFGKPLADQGVTMERIANSRIMIDQCRLLVLHAAWKMDTVGNKEARREIAEIKVSIPNMACQVLDWAVQMHGGGGVSDDFGLAKMYATARTMRIVDGPDEVHRHQLGRLELAKYRPVRPNALAAE